MNPLNEPRNNLINILDMDVPPTNDSGLFGGARNKTENQGVRFERRNEFNNSADGVYRNADGFHRHADGHNGSCDGNMRGNFRHPSGDLRFTSGDFHRSSPDGGFMTDHRDGSYVSDHRRHSSCCEFYPKESRKPVRCLKCDIRCLRCNVNRTFSEHRNCDSCDGFCYVYDDGKIRSRKRKNDVIAIESPDDSSDEEIILTQGWRV